MRLLFIACVVVGSFGSITSPHAMSAQQAAGDGERVYALVSQSVLPITTIDGNGAVTGTASGFLVSADQLLTNAHVADGGAMRVSLGAFDVPCSLERSDSISDLALCRIPAKSGVAPLVLAKEDPKPGATIFAVGNPQGLERTISQGLFTGFRVVDGQQRVQISAAISQGSSGGPVLNSEGLLVGVAVSFLDEGQNLNFAVPLAVVRRFLDDEASPTTSATMLASVKSLQAKLAPLPSAAKKDAEYQRQTAQLDDLLHKLVAAASDPAELREIADIATASYRPRALVRASRKLVQLSTKPSPDAHARLARGLYWSSDDASSPDLVEAESHAGRAIELGLHTQDHFVLLGDIQSRRQRYQKAYASYERAITVPFAATSDVLFRLFTTATELDRDTEAVTWFNRAKAVGLRPPHMVEFARFLESRARYAEAGAAHEDAARAAPDAYQSICDAGRTYSWAGSLDQSLAANRECISRAAAVENAKSYVQAAHRLIAEVLNTREVFEQAEIHARQAIQLGPEDPFAYLDLSESLAGQKRPSEAVVTAKTAIRLSDGKYGRSYMALGAALSDLKQFAEAAHAFQKAAELVPADSVSAYNAAVSFYHVRFYVDSLQWYREALRRDPNSDRKEEIAKMIAFLSNLR
jgi:tetratricopeptide (TPR) repeat protein